MLAQVCNKFLRLRAEAACRDDTKHGVGRVHGAAREQMAHCAAPGLLIIGGDAAQIHPVADRLRRLVCERELEQTLLDRRDIVAGCAVKALDHAAVFHADGVNRLIAIAERVFHADDILHRCQNAADACERIVDTRSLHAQLFAVIHVLQAAATAGAVDRAGRLCARSGRGQALLRLAVDGICRHLQDAHLPRLADERAFHKYGAAGDMAHTGTFGCIPRDLGSMQLVFCKLLHGLFRFLTGDVHIFVIRAAAVNDAVRCDLNDAVGDRLRELVVVAGKDNVIRESIHAVIERRDALEVKVVRRLVKDEEVCAGEHHLRDHAAHLLAAGEDLDLLVHIVTGKEHPAEERAQVALALICGELAHPVDEVVVAVFKIAVVILREVGLRG